MGNFVAGDRSFGLDVCVHNSFTLIAILSRSVVGFQRCDAVAGFKCLF